MNVHGLTRALRLIRGDRIVGLRCQTCGREWDVAHRGRETGFCVAAADSHAIKCSREHEASTTKEISTP